MEPTITTSPSPETAARQGPPSSGQSPGPWESVLGRDLDRFLAERTFGKALALWLGPELCRPGTFTRALVIRRLLCDIARLDALLNRQVNAILHAPRFQQMEASWRGLRYLVEQIPGGTAIKVRILNISWKELTRDLERALEFDQSQLFRKIYSEEFGTPGGEPYGVLLGDYEMHHRPGPDHPVDDIAALEAISQVAAAAFAPFIAGLHPSFLGLESFAGLERSLNLARTFEQLEYLKWKALRQTEDARFVGLVLPRALARLPYPETSSRTDGFRFREETAAPDRTGHLWSPAVYAFGSVLIQAFAECGWLADIRGIREGGAAGGGLVAGLPAPSFVTDRAGIVPKSSTDAAVTDFQEKDLAEQGFISLCRCPDTPLAAFYSNPSIQQPKKYDEAPATANARLSAMLQYVLCVSRFAHYLKVIGRDKVGSFAGPKDCETYLNKWLLNYIVASDEVDLDTKARFPLRDAQVQVSERPGKPGNYMCVMQLRPHFQLDQLVTAVRLMTELTPGQAS